MLKSLDVKEKHRGKLIEFEKRAGDFSKKKEKETRESIKESTKNRNTSDIKEKENIYKNYKKNGLKKDAKTNAQTFLSDLKVVRSSGNNISNPSAINSSSVTTVSNKKKTEGPIIAAKS